MIVEARFRRRSEANENVRIIHEGLLSKLRENSFLWKKGCSISDVFLDYNNEESGACDLDGFLNEGLQGALSYSSRNLSNLDKAISDDFFTLTLDTEMQSYSDFVLRQFNEIIRLFKPYRATVILYEDLDLDDYDMIVEETSSSGLDIDGRDSVFRLNTANFFDEELCKRAFRKNPKEIFFQLRGEVEFVDLISNGVTFCVTSELITVDQLKALDGKLRPKIEGKVLKI